MDKRYANGLPGWDRFFIEEAFNYARKSPDPSTKCAAVVVSDDNTPLVWGFNGLVRGMIDTPERWSRPLKYDLVVHAEKNAVYNAARHGIRLLGSRMYATLRPCGACAECIVQAGIKEVIVPRRDWDSPNYAAYLFDLADEKFCEGGVTLRYVDMPT
jgi:dCMP deaminase